MPEWIQHIDEALLRFIHVNLGSSWLDTLMPLLRNPYFWAPVYLYLLVFLWRSYGIKGLWWCLFFIMTFAFSDFISASLIKPWVHRVRPCNENHVLFTIRHLIDCGSGFSFPSSHATNHMAFAVFISLTIGKKYRIAIPLAFLWALLVCLAQLYVCVHYPSDILAGSLLGALIGWFFARYFQVRFGSFNMNPEHT